MIEFSTLSMLLGPTICYISYRDLNVITNFGSLMQANIDDYIALLLSYRLAKWRR